MMMHPLSSLTMWQNVSKRIWNTLARSKWSSFARPGPSITPNNEKEACILCGCGLFYVWSFLSEFTSWSQFALPRQGNETKGAYIFELKTDCLAVDMKGKGAIFIAF